MRQCSAVRLTAMQIHMQPAHPIRAVCLLFIALCTLEGGRFDANGPCLAQFSMIYVDKSDVRVEKTSIFPGESRNSSTKREVWLHSRGNALSFPSQPQRVKDLIHSDKIHLCSRD
ncbi:hypothetical protein Q8A67_021703 [Cirrhinus molitorella]|uniref:Uncharacterized protein n=1 Tax=Cirrhinus molitorella TaxID=172907 RepID=A0AA88PB84_9TELE|nr:hypothetical protein Q8A67_021703 [Cirrhinus molitorella]